jgi:hypothetical protein
LVGQPAEQKERASRAMAIQAFKQLVDASPNPAGAGKPFAPRHHRLKRLDLEIFLHVDGEKVRRTAMVWLHLFGRMCRGRAELL